MSFKKRSREDKSTTSLDIPPNMADVQLPKGSSEESTTASKSKVKFALGPCFEENKRNDSLDFTSCAMCKKKIYAEYATYMFCDGAYCSIYCRSEAMNKAGYA